MPSYFQAIRGSGGGGSSGADWQRRARMRIWLFSQRSSATEMERNREIEI